MDAKGSKGSGEQTNEASPYSLLSSRLSNARQMEVEGLEGGETKKGVIQVLKSPNNLFTFSFKTTFI